MVWCPMITAQYVIAQRVVGRALAPERRTGLERYFLGPRAADGGWGSTPKRPAPSSSPRSCTSRSACSVSAATSPS